MILLAVSGIMLAGVSAIMLIVFVPAQKDVHGVIPQRSRNDCAVAATTMLLQDMGRDVDYEDVNTRFMLSQNGASVQDILDVVRSFDSAFAAWSVTPSDVRSVLPPAILFVENTHFVVLDSVTSDRVHLRDPMRGRISPSTHDLNGYWTGIVIQRKVHAAAP